MTDQRIENIDAAIANLNSARRALVVAHRPADKITITLDLPEENEDERALITWGDFRKMIEHNTPAADYLEVREGLSNPIELETTWGTLRVEATRDERPKTFIVPDLYSFNLKVGDRVVSQRSIQYRFGTATVHTVERQV